VLRSAISRAGFNRSALIAGPQGENFVEFGASSICL
jgi:hypothetical protein